MKRLRGSYCLLRALEPEDLDFLFRLENDTALWEVSEASAPYSRALLKEYLKQQHRNLWEVQQLRLVIERTEDHKAIGLIDLFEIDARNRHAGVGIVIQEESDRKKGAGGEALELLCDYSFNLLGLHQLYAKVGTGNTASESLFERHGFFKAGLLKDWRYANGSFSSITLYQRISHVS